MLSKTFLFGVTPNLPEVSRVPVINVLISLERIRLPAPENYELTGVVPCGFLNRLWGHHDFFIKVLLPAPRRGGL